MRHFDTPETQDELATSQRLAQTIERERNDPTILPSKQRLTDLQRARQNEGAPNYDVRLNRPHA